MRVSRRSSYKRSAMSLGTKTAKVLPVVIHGVAEDAGDVEWTEGGVPAGSRPARLVEGTHDGQRLTSKVGEPLQGAVEAEVGLAHPRAWLRPGPVRFVDRGEVAQSGLVDVGLDRDQVADDLLGRPLARGAMAGRGRSSGRGDAIREGSKRVEQVVPPGLSAAHGTSVASLACRQRSVTSTALNR